MIWEPLLKVYVKNVYFLSFIGKGKTTTNDRFFDFFENNLSFLKEFKEFK